MNSLIPGTPGSFPLPNSGQKGTAFNTSKMHPAAMAASPRTNPMNTTPPAMAGKK